MVALSKNKRKKARDQSRVTREPSPSLSAHRYRLALPQEEIRRLVLRSTIGYKIEPFVRQMVRVMDNIKAGRIRKVANLTISKRDPLRAHLITAISNAAREGNTLAAHETAFMAALYAYEISLDHLRAFMRYMDSLRKSPRTKGSSVKLR